ncbi:carboxymuconolactone decarboxylase family protein, partial [Streptomyces prunicolor]|uniref:carboxymuconolactone decarboxylase family protein n=1 Tax=Streptomyces prunicolor TaxID=67348 RepID=UPI0033CA2CDC
MGSSPAFGRDRFPTRTARAALVVGCRWPLWGSPTIGGQPFHARLCNHCAFCLDMHTKDALAAGESVERIIQLGAWE